jgi:hypothetical protein
MKKYSCPCANNLTATLKMEGKKPCGNELEGSGNRKNRQDGRGQEGRKACLSFFLRHTDTFMRNQGMSVL